MRLTPHRLKPCRTGDLRAGDHIAVRRSGGYVHHGVYLGEGRVAHFSDEGGLAGKRGACVKASPLEAFLRGGRLLRRRHRWARRPEEAAGRALGVLRGSIPWKPYHLMRNNCEHFATFCAARRPRSVQVEQVAGTAVALSTLMGAALLRRRSGPSG